MTAEKLSEAIGGIDPIFIKEAEEYSPEERKKKDIWLRLGSIAAAFCLVFSIALGIGLSGKSFDSESSNAEDSQVPDKAIVFGLGEKCESEVYGGYKSMVINGVTVSKKIGDAERGEGGFLIFEGEIYAENFAFSSDSISLGFSYLNSEGYVPERCSFEKELSVEASEVTLLFDGERGKMDGSFCFVFSLNESDYRALSGITVESAPDSSGTTDNAQSSDWIVELDPDITWGGGFTLFKFDKHDISRGE